MTIKEYWDICLDKPVAENLEMHKEFFSTPLTDSVLEEYDFTEVLLELFGRLESAKEFENYKELAEIFRENQQYLYEDGFQYVDFTLSQVSGHLGDLEGLKKHFEFFKKYPTKDDEFTSLILSYAIYYNTSPILENFSKTVYSKLLELGEEESIRHQLEYSIYLVELEKIYNSNDFSQESQDKLKEIIKQYDIKLDQGYLDNIFQNFAQKKLNNPPINTAFFEKNRDLFLFDLSIKFKKYMHKRGISFSVSSEIFNSIEDYWRSSDPYKHGIWRPKEDYPIEGYFPMELISFDDHWQIMNDFIGYGVDSFAVCWGSHFVYDFLRELDLISKEHHASFLNIQEALRGEIMKENSFSSWMNSFVHKWGKPDSLAEEKFEIEKKLFEKSFSIEESFTLFEETPEAKEFNHEIATFYPEPMKKEPHRSMWDNISRFKTEPYVKPKTYGRNEKVKVKYKDDTEKEVKYKKVMKDIEQGKCEVLE